MTSNTSYYCTRSDYTDQTSCEAAGATWVTKTVQSQTRNINLTDSTWVKVISNPVDGPVIFTCDASFTWAISTADPSSTVGFTGSANTLVSLLPNTVVAPLWIKVSGSGKKCIISGGTTVVLS